MSSNLNIFNQLNNIGLLEMSDVIGGSNLPNIL